MSTVSSPATAKAKSFTDLVAWREAHALVLFIYSVTKHFPKEEIGLMHSIRQS